MAGWSAAPTSGTLVGFIRRGFPSGTWWLQGPNKNHRIKLSKAIFLVDDVIFFCLSPIFFKLVIAYSSPQKDARTYLLFMVVRWCFPHNFQYIYIHTYIYTNNLYTNKLYTFLSGGCYISNTSIFVWSPWLPPEEALFWAHLLRRTDLLEIDLLEPALMHWEAARTGGFLSHGNTPNSSNIEAFSNFDLEIPPD